MPRLNLNQHFDDDFQFLGDRRQRRKNNRRKINLPEQVVSEIATQMDGLENFDFTYNASRHEREWITQSLEIFFDQQWIFDVLRVVKGGKEASVYQCLADADITAEHIAAKIYRPRRFRNLKNDYIYREGREMLDSDGNPITDDGMLHAIRKRTEFGRQLMHTSWIEHEYAVLKLLHAADADVPIPYASGDNAILMAYIGGVDQPAPTLNEIQLERSEAERLFDKLLHNIDLMLSKGVIHADLSAYNILYWEGQITLIDFPQAIAPDENRNAYGIFQRDIVRVCEYFRRQGVVRGARRLAAELWSAHHYRIDPEIHPKLLDDQDEHDRAYWESISQ